MKKEGEKERERSVIEINVEILITGYALFVNQHLIILSHSYHFPQSTIFQSLEDYIK